jgi:hypothetical protein
MGMIEKIKLLMHKDNLTWGLILGVGGPVLGFFVCFFILWIYGLSLAGGVKMSFLSFITSIFHGNKSSIISLSVLANLPCFYLYLNREKYITVRGIVLATIIYSVVVLFLFWAF